MKTFWLVLTKDGVRVKSGFRVDVRGQSQGQEFACDERSRELWNVSCL